MVGRGEILCFAKSSLFVKVSPSARSGIYTSGPKLEGEEGEDRDKKRERVIQSHARNPKWVAKGGER